MVDSVNTDNTAAALYSKLNPAKTEKKSANEEAGEKFLTLLTTQLKNQDPLNPMDNAELTSQLAQINTVQGIAKLNDTMQAFLAGNAANNTLQAASLVGRQVLVPGVKLNLDEAGASGGLRLDSAASDVQVKILSPSGTEVALIKMGDLEAGSYDFSWDGASIDGARAANGEYRVEIAGKSGDEQVLGTYLERGVVSSVAREKNNITIELAGLGKYGIDEITQIR